MHETPPSFAAPAEADAVRIRIEVAIQRNTRDIERQVRSQLLARVLEYTGGDKVAAAEILGVSLKTLYNRLNAPEHPQA